MAILLVRHAVAVARHRWPGDDADRPLTHEGRRQAALLVEQLAGFAPTDIRSSPSRRCVDTVAPLAADVGLEVRHDSSLAEGNGRSAAGVVRSLVQAPGATVLCTHGDVIPDVLVALDHDGARLGDGIRCEKGSTWLLERAGRGRLVGRYLRPPSTRGTEPVTVRAAGGVVWRDGAGGSPEVLLVHRPRYDDWTLPKGKAGAAEADEECARREVEEETGLRCELGDHLADVAYVDHEGRAKVARFWAMRPLAGTFVPGREVDEVRWLPVGAARHAVTYPRDVPVLDAFAALVLR